MYRLFVVPRKEMKCDDAVVQKARALSRLPDVSLGGVVYVGKLPIDLTHYSLVNFINQI